MPTPRLLEVDITATAPRPIDITAQVGALVVNTVSREGTSVTVSLTAPSSPSVGDQWFKPDTKQLYVFNDSIWNPIGADIDQSIETAVSLLEAEIDKGDTFIFQYLGTIEDPVNAPFDVTEIIVAEIITHSGLTPDVTQVHTASYNEYAFLTTGPNGSTPGGGMYQRVANTWVQYTPEKPRLAVLHPVDPTWPDARVGLAGVIDPGGGFSLFNFGLSVLLSILNSNSIAALGAVKFKGILDCSSSPDYPAADRGDWWALTEGKIGGTSGVDVSDNDVAVCNMDDAQSGDEVFIGSSWTIIRDGRSTTGVTAHKSTHAIGGDDALSPSDIGAVTDDDERLSDSRTPTAHKSTHATGQSDALSPSDIGAVATDDSRLTNSRTPTAHKSSHATGQSDAISPSDIGAVATTRKISGVDLSADRNFKPTSAMFDCAADDWVPLFTQISSLNTINWGGTAQNSMNVGVVWFPIYIPSRIGVKGLALEIVTGNAGASAAVRAVLAASTNGRPGTIVAQGTAGINSPGIKEITWTEAFASPGWHWVGTRVESLDTSGTNPSYRGLSAYSNSPNPPNSTTVSGTGQMGSVTTAGASSSTITDNPTTAIAHSGTVSRPAMWIKVGTP